MRDGGDKTSNFRNYGDDLVLPPLCCRNVAGRLGFNTISTAHPARGISLRTESARNRKPERRITSSDNKQLSYAKIWTMRCHLTDQPTQTHGFHCQIRHNHNKSPSELLQSTSWCWLAKTRVRSSAELPGVLKEMSPAGGRQGQTADAASERIPTDACKATSVVTSQ
jgi:hypothetical protein